MPRVLLVDDNDDFCATLAEQLRRTGYRVATARDGYSALTEVIRHRPDVIVSDIVMPPPDGIRLMQMLRSQGILIPFVLMTGQDAPAQHGACAVLVKPFRVQELCETIERVLDAATSRESPRL